MSPRGIRGIATLACLAVSTTGAIAQQEDAGARARATRLVAEGTAQYDRKEFTGALASFEEAERIYPSPKISYNRGLALAGLQRLPEAGDAFARFLAEAKDAPSSAILHATAVLADIDARVGRLEVSAQGRKGPLSAAITIDGRPAGDAPVVRRVAPGEHKVEASYAGHRPLAQSEVVAAGQVVSLALTLVPVDLEPKPAPPPATEKPLLDSTASGREGEPAPFYRRWWFWTAVGAVALAGTITAVALASGSDEPDTELGTIEPF